MANDEAQSPLTGEVLEEEMELTLVELCRACQVPAERVIEIVAEGVIEPLGRDPAHWRFQGVNVQRIRFVLRMEHDLGVNIAGAALALNLLEELEELHARLRYEDDNNL
ncbi:MAG TPA: MerR family transcriptional regulator [Gammaproteobacteria bacterium]|nr:MerR family transcriptional regulator [Gammaproteobacteria bacterium]